MVLITKNNKNNLATVLHKFGILYIFDSIIHLEKTAIKTDYMKKNGLLIDDSFSERKEAINNGIYAFGIDCIDLLLN